MVKLYKKSLLTLLDYSKEEIIEILNMSFKLKSDKKAGIYIEKLRHKNIALVFEKTSTRTRCAFEVAAYDLGANVTYLDPSGSQMGTKESVKDTARVLGRMYDAIMYRGHAHSKLLTLNNYSGVPVYNGLTDHYHPTQALADILTIKEHTGDLNNITVTYVGSADNNVCHSLMIITAKLGGNLIISSPPSLKPNEDIYKKCQEISKETGATISYMKDPVEAVKDTDVIYTDVWVSMGEDKSSWAERINILKPYQVNIELLTYAKKEVKYMHCLPSFHNLESEVAQRIYSEFGLKELEVTDEIHESKHSIVFDQAENRLHTIKALLLTTLSKKY